MDDPPAASTMHRCHRPARHVGTPSNTTGHDTGLLACELALACLGLLRHNSMATWRQLPGGADADDETCRPIYCPLSAIVHLGQPDGIRPDIRAIQRSVVRRPYLGQYNARVSDVS